AAHVLPPTTYGLGREVGGVMVNADADPTFIIGQVEDAIGNCFTQGRILKVVHTHLFRLALRSPFPARILEISHQFLLFRVYRHHGLSAFLQAAYLGADVLDWGMAAELPGPCVCLTVCL